MGTLKLNTTSGGSVSIQAADGASDNTVTLPAVSGANIITSADSGTVTQGMIGSGVSSTGPAFHAYQTTQQTGVTNTVFTKVNLQTEEFDLTNDFDTSLSRFTPSVAGYYYMCGKVEGGSNPAGQGTSILSIYKNGSRYREGVLNINNTNSRQFPHVSGICYANGTTDYFELYIYADGMASTWNLSAGADIFRKYFSASLVRAA